jgi:hypothetical protein
MRAAGNPHATMCPISECSNCSSSSWMPRLYLRRKKRRRPRSFVDGESRVDEAALVLPVIDQLAQVVMAEDLSKLGAHG